MICSSFILVSVSGVFLLLFCIFLFLSFNRFVIDLSSLFSDYLTGDFLIRYNLHTIVLNIFFRKFFGIDFLILNIFETKKKSKNYLTCGNLQEWTNKTTFSPCMCLHCDCWSVTLDLIYKMSRRFFKNKPKLEKLSRLFSTLNIHTSPIYDDYIWIRFKYILKKRSVAFLKVPTRPSRIHPKEFVLAYMLYRLTVEFIAHLTGFVLDHKFRQKFICN